MKPRDKGIKKSRALLKACMLKGINGGADIDLPMDPTKMVSICPEGMNCFYVSRNTFTDARLDGLITEVYILTEKGRKYLRENK
jgi:hypothetical protein